MINRSTILPPIQNQNDVRGSNANAQRLQRTDGNDFRQAMDNALGMSELNFSKHASLRLLDRNIELTNSQLERVESGVIKARNKGIRDSLVLVDNVALVVNVTNKTVITAIGKQEQIFTNIDGAVIV